MRFLLLLCLGAGSALSQVNVPANRRVDCYPEPGAYQQACESRGCTWISDNTYPNTPWCFYPPNTGYSLSSQGSGTVSLQKTSQPGSPYGPDASTLTVNYQAIGPALSVNIFDPSAGYTLPPQLPFPLTNDLRQLTNGADSSDLSFSSSTSNGMFYFQVRRKSTGSLIFDTSIGGMIYSPQYLQLAAIIVSKIYGFGEFNHVNFMHDQSAYNIWPMFARDEPPSPSQPGKNLYGAHPFYLGLETDGNAHGVFFLNTHAQEFEVGPNSLQYRVIGGDFRMYFLPGPTPENVIQQYHTLIGKPYLPAYWSLGFQICRYGYSGTTEMQQVLNRTRACNIPQDVQYADIDYMDERRDFTYDHNNFGGLPQLIDNLHQQNMSVILILDPAIAVNYSVFDDGKTNGQYITWPNMSVVPDTNAKYPSTSGTDIMLSVVWPSLNVAFPDFFFNNTINWWYTELQKMHDNLPLRFDGIWIDMNEPSAFSTNEGYLNDADHNNIPTLNCPKDYLEAPPYLTWALYQYGGSQMSMKTLCMYAKHGGRQHYEMHNLYGWSEAVATAQGVHKLFNKRSGVVGRSTFPSSGVYEGHWLGDNTATWNDLATSIIGQMEMNMFGITYTGADVCGFNGASNEELCLRWQQLGAWSTFFRNHNSINMPPQDPGYWPSTVGVATRVANEFRYKYLPYLYTQLYLSSKNGGTVFRPLMFEFTSDSNTHQLKYQFMWGPAILVSPVVYQGATSVSAYIPQGTWYTLTGAAQYGSVISSLGETITLQAPTTSMIPSHVRAGYILPRQSSALNTYASRASNFQLLIAVNPANQQASGSLFWDNGEDLNYVGNNYQITFTYNNKQLSIKTTGVGNRPNLPPLEQIEIFGASSSPQNVMVNGSPAGSYQSQYSGGVAQIGFNSPIDITQSSTIISWS